MRTLLAAVRTRWVVGLALGVLAGLVFWATGLSPWPLVAVTIVVATMCVAQRASWPFALAAAMIVTLAAYAVLMRLAPFTGLGLAMTGGIALGVSAV
ncbi:MAG: hypothetical protein QM598_10425, partial [Protaetiibacter sp.]